MCSGAGKINSQLIFIAQTKEKCASLQRDVAPAQHSKDMHGFVLLEKMRLRIQTN